MLMFNHHCPISRISYEKFITEQLVIDRLAHIRIDLYWNGHSSVFAIFDCSNEFHDRFIPSEKHTVDDSQTSSDWHRICSIYVQQAQCEQTSTRMAIPLADSLDDSQQMKFNVFLTRSFNILCRMLDKHYAIVHVSCSVDSFILRLFILVVKHHIKSLLHHVLQSFLLRSFEIEWNAVGIDDSSSTFSMQSSNINRILANNELTWFNGDMCPLILSWLLQHTDTHVNIYE
jgi:hypothetical protein